MKKAISLILTVLMLFSMFPTAISAEELNKPEFSIELVEVNPGETFDVDITLANNPGIVSANLKIAFDEGLTLIGAENGDVFSTLTYIPPKQLSSGGQIASSCQFAWTGFDIADDDIKNGKILTLTFKASDDVEIGESLNVSITTESGDVIDKNLNSVLLSAQSTVEVVEKTEISPLFIASVTGAPGETVVVDVSLTKNPGIVSASLKVAFDKGLTLVGATNGDVFSTLTYIPPKQLSTSGQITSSCQFAWTGFDIADKDIKDGIILSLLFKISENAKIGDLYNIIISSESGDVIDKNLNSVILNDRSTVKIVEAYKPCEHTGGTATCKSKAKCSVCGEEYGSLTSCNYAPATCTTPKTCKVCDATEGKANGHKFDNECDTTCNSCSYTRTTSHKGGTATCTTKAKCATCGKEYGSLVACDYAAATCTAPKICKVCGATSGSKLGHKYTNVCDTSCNTCKATRKITHSYKTYTTKATLTKNGKVENKCTACGHVSKTTVIYAPKTVKLSATSYTYNGKVKTPSVTVKDSKGKTLKKDAEYTVKYSSGRKNPGKYTVTVTFKGKYSGTKKLSFTIKPKVVTLSKVTAGSKQLTANWKTVAAVTGYEVQASTSSKFTSKTTKKVTLKSAKTKKTTIKKLKKGKKYYVKVRAYKTVDGKKIYGAWSAVKSVKIK